MSPRAYPSYGARPCTAAARRSRRRSGRSPTQRVAKGVADTRRTGGCRTTNRPSLLRTEGGTRALRDLDLFRCDRDTHAATLTTLDGALSLKFEQAAPLPGDRIAALRAFHLAAIFTWVSLEPVLSPEHSLAVVEATHEFVDLFTVGRTNNMGVITKDTDWQSYTLRMVELLNRLGKPHYVKRDLQKYLPPGYPNSMRVPQHH